MQRADFRFFDRLRVRWAEVDMQKIVFNGHYLMYFDTAVAGWWRALALPYHETMESLAGDLYVRKATVEYLGSARYDEVCDVGIRCERIGTSSMLLHTALFRADRLLVHGELLYVFADPATQTSKPVPAALRELLLAFEAGASMIDWRLGGWDEVGAAARAVRHAVFIDELGWPSELEHDSADLGSTHLVAVNRLGTAVAGGRLLAAADGVGRIGRLAVVPALRCGGIGRSLLDRLVDGARSRGDREVQLDAQVGAADFYRRAGFVAHGASFERAGVMHQAMSLTLAR
jgi:YbgC/YbaW family acyl-CoA thioester hydrolase